MVEVPLLPNDIALLEGVDACGVEVHLNAAGSSANLPDEAGDNFSPPSNSSVRATASRPSHDSLSPSYQPLMAARPLMGPASIHDGSVMSSAFTSYRSAKAS